MDNALASIRTIAVAIALLAPPIAHAGEVYTGAWGGMVPASIEFLSDTELRICLEDLVHRCQAPVPFTRQGETIVVEHLTSGRKWTYTPRADGGYDASYFRWDGEGSYNVLSTAILRPR